MPPSRTPTPAPALDQQQPTLDLAVGGLSIGQQRLAQVVTAGRVGRLVEVQMPVSCSSGDLIVEIQEVAGGAPSGAVIASQTVPGHTLPGDFPANTTFKPLVFSSPATVQIGSRFAIVLRSDGSCASFQGPIGDSYTGGTGYYADRSGPWTYLGSRADLPFQTYVLP